VQKKAGPKEPYKKNRTKKSPKETERAMDSILNPKTGKNGEQAKEKK